MTPEPTPVSGMTPWLVSTWLLTVMRTTAGLTLDATAIVADDSSIVTGWVDPTVWPAGVVDEAGADRSSAPVAPSAKTVPPEARIADRTAAATTVPPEPRVPVRWTGAVVGVGVTPGAVVPASGAAEVGASGVGSYQRSGVFAGASWRDHAGRLSGVGVKRSTAGSVEPGVGTSWRWVRSSAASGRSWSVIVPGFLWAAAAGERLRRVGSVFLSRVRKPDSSATRRTVKFPSSRADRLPSACGRPRRPSRPPRHPRQGSPRPSADRPGGRPGTGCRRRARTRR